MTWQRSPGHTSIMTYVTNPLSCDLSHQPLITTTTTHGSFSFSFLLRKYKLCLPHEKLCLVLEGKLENFMGSTSLFTDSQFQALLSPPTHPHSHTLLLFLLTLHQSGQ